MRHSIDSPLSIKYSWFRHLGLRPFALVLLTSTSSLADPSCINLERETCTTACATESSSVKATCEDRCLELRCGADSWSMDGSTPVVDTGLENRPECNSEHTTICGDECRKKFDSEHTKCKSDCLSRLCRSFMATVSGDSATDSERSTCIEFESGGCVEECSSEDGHRKLRCRRGCLSKKCPGGSQSEILKESMEPGRLKCDRCKVNMAAACKRQCYFGIGTGQIYSDRQKIGHLGCEQLCLSTSCSQSCGASLPFSIIP